MNEGEVSEADKPIEDFSGKLTKIASEPNQPSSFDGESLRKDLQATLEKAREIVSKYPTGGEVQEQIETSFLKGISSIDRVRTHDLEDVNLAHAWPETVNKLTDKGRVLDIEVRDISDSSLQAIKQLRESSTDRSRLIITIDSNDVNYKSQSPEEIRNSIKGKLGNVLANPAEGRDYSIIFINELEDVALTQIQELLVNNPKSIYVDVNNEVWFKPIQPDNPFSLLEIKGEQIVVLPGIKVLDSNGNPTKDVLEAASFINAVNADTVHLIFSESGSMEDRDRIWELVHAMSTRPIDYRMYHEVFYKSGQLDHAMSVFSSELQTSQSNVSATENKASKEFNDFGFDWDVVEYVSRNYGEKILPEDQQIINFVLGKLSEERNSGELPLNSLKSVADIGAGPNLYTLMMLMPYVSEDAVVKMADYTPANRKFLEWFRDGEPEGSIYEPLRGAYKKFEDFMVSVDPSYQGAYEKLRSLLKNSDASIDFVNLYAPLIGDTKYDAIASSAERQKLDLVTSAFVTESMATSESEFVLLTYNVLKNLKDGGRFTLMHMAGSEGYNAGVDNNFPAAKVNIDSINRIYGLLVGEGNFTAEMVEDENEKAREGYEGMIVVTGRLQKPLPSLRKIFNLDEELKIAH